ncbi:hypothetical protein CABS01_09589 [Colletotrichum abscissum]|uniref:uncharacterized protein n=1 Tax=Colletotrichum abscissum TaxID=1671311 RepID=UPI0027D6355D|nr:uncharacterized protein CABS01_09589 [Colletotrichum abscissum]KAK1501858.1 hypothetical protein CABS01_09589 [Colletotrichum abscissum]
MLVAQPPNQPVTSLYRNWLLSRTTQAFFPNRTVLRVRRLRLVSETFAQSQRFFESLYFMS